ncbi:MAG: twin-arginine translocation signal domain-containing protein, partial [Planctomycetota bacterium]
MSTENRRLSHFPKAGGSTNSRRNKPKDTARRHKISRRKFVAQAATAAGLVGLLETDKRVEANQDRSAPISSRESIKITKLETFVLRNSWVFVKISTDAGIVGWGEM